MNSKTPGDYRYKVELQFVDPTDKFLMEAVGIMKADLSALSDYLGLFSQRRLDESRVASQKKLKKHFKKLSAADGISSEIHGFSKSL